MKKKTVLIVLIIFSCIAMALVDGVIQPGYAVKSGIKILLFLLVPIIYAHLCKEVYIKDLFKTDKKSFFPSLGLGLVIYALIVGGYFALRGVFDFSAVTGALAESVGVTGKNFIFVSLYISFVNSLLEEFFFRGFAFLTLKKLSSRRFSYIFSSLAFSLYHVAMMVGWFSIPLFLLLLAGLFIGGVIFNFLNEKSGSIYSSWLVHMFANFGINTVGFILFG